MPTDTTTIRGTEDRTRSVLAKVMGINDDSEAQRRIVPDAKLVKDLGLGGGLGEVEFLELDFELEKEFADHGLKVSDVDQSDFQAHKLTRTFGELVKFVENKIG